MDENIIGQLKNLSRNVHKIAKLLKDHQQLQDHPIDNVYMIEKNVVAIQKMTNMLPESDVRSSLQSWLDQAKKDLVKTKDDFKFQFGQQLKDLLARDSMQVRGQYPLLRIGMYTLQVDFEFGQATLYFGPEVEKVRSAIPLQPHIVYEAIKKFDSELHNLDTPEGLAKDLARAYERQLRLDGKQWGEKVSLVEVLSEFVILRQPKQFVIDPRKSHFREYSRVKLSYMLSVAKKSASTMRLHVATFDATIDKLHSLWVPEDENGEGTYYAHISFEKAP